MSFHLLLIESIRVRRVHPLRVFVAFLRDMERDNLSRQRETHFSSKGMHIEASLAIQVEEISTIVKGGPICMDFE
jgi:hypothetical protein